MLAAVVVLVMVERSDGAFARRSAGAGNKLADRCERAWASASDGRVNRDTSADGRRGAVRSAASQPCAASTTRESWQIRIPPDRFNSERWVQGAANRPQLKRLGG